MRKTTANALVLLTLALATSWLGAADCNENGTEDAADIADAVSEDCNQDGVPDECGRWPLLFALRADDASFDVGAVPFDFAIGDLDGDGRLDLATANTDASVSVLLNRGRERFELVGKKAAGEDLRAIRLADLNQDDRLDLIAAGADSIGVFLQDATAAPGEASYLTGLEDLRDPRGLGVADLDGNGTPDLAVADNDTSVVVVFSGRGDGTFEDAESFATGERPSGLVVADVDGDGLVDIVTANDLSHDVTVLINVGGAFSAPMAFSTGGRPRLLTQSPGANGAPDLLVVVGRRVGRLKNNGDGSFSELETLHEIKSNISAYADADLDRDGTRDLLLAPAVSATVQVLRGRVDGGFAAPQVLGVDGFPRRMIARDLDGDGDCEILLVSQHPAVRVLWRDAGGVIPFETTDSPAVTQRPHSATSGDFNGDGLVDVITANGSDRGVTLFLSQGDGTLAAGVTLQTGGYLNSIAAVDFEGDGDLDVLGVDPKADALYVVENTDGQGTMGNPRSHPAGREPFMVATGDVDEDGDPDAVVANASGFDVGILLNNGAGTFTAAMNVPVGTRPVAVAVADLNGDSHLDIAASNSVSKDTTVLLGNGDATFMPGVHYPVPGQPFYVAAADLDGDGDLDLVSGSGTTVERLTVLMGVGDGSFTIGGAFDSVQPPYSLITSDLDGDGRVDVVTANQAPNSLSVLQGAGDGTFSGISVYGVGDDPRFVMALDLDADGDQDLVAANHTSRDLTVLLNRSAESKFGGDYLSRICSRRDFDAVSVPARAPVERAAKYILPASDDPELLPPLFQNVARFRLHQEFLATVFPDRFPALPPAEYNQLVGRRATRLYHVGVISRLRGPEDVVYGFNIVTDPSDSQELLTLEEVRAVYERLREAFLLEPLAYSPDTPPARERAAGWSDPGFPVFLDDGDEDIEYEAYTRAVGYGRVRLLDADGFEAANENGEASFQSILVLEEAPRDIEGVVGGVITAQRQGELSHVAIRTARRGTPNAFVANATSVFAPYEGKLVRLEVRAAEFFVEETSLDEAEAFWAESRPVLSELPSLDAEFVELSSLDEIASMDLIAPQEVRFGGKATNLARLGRLFTGSEFERFREIGFAIPVRYYLEFLRANRTVSDLDPSREVTYEEYLTELLASPEFQSDSKLRFRKLDAFRELARDEGLVDAALVEAILTRIADVFPSTRTPVRFRSSSNVEDALEFNGAGLYESTGGCADDELDDDDEGPSLCDPSKGSERDIRRALKKVWTSIYTFRAFEERAFFGIPEDRVAMAILVSRAFPDELANGVAFTGNISNPLDRRFVVTVQLGEESVVHPDPGVLPEKDILEVTDGKVSSIVRPVFGSTLVEPGTWILSDTHLQEMGAVLAFVDDRFPLDLGDYTREEVLLDLEFKLEPDNSLAFKQVRPFLLTDAPPPAPEFAIEIPEGTSICAVFSVAGAARGPRDEYELKSTLRLRAGTIRLTTSADSFEAELVDEVLFGRAREQAEAVAPGRFRVQTIPRPDGTTVYRFNYEQSFTLASGSILEIRGETPLEFVGRDGESLSAPLELDDAFFTVLAGREAIQAKLDGDPLVRYGSCEYESLPRWIVSAELEDGTTLRLDERFEEAESLNDTGPAALVRATVGIGEETRVVTDYFDLIYSAFRHNTEVHYWVVLDPPVELAGLAAPVHVLEFIAPEPTQGVEAAVNYRDASLAVLASPAVRANGRTRLTDPADVSFLRGDANSNIGLTISDGIFILNYLFFGRMPDCIDAADTDDGGNVNVADAVYLLNFLFGGGPSPAEPFGECGIDPTIDALGCEAFAGCER